MAFTVMVKNASGVPLNVALFIAESAGAASGTYSLVWKLKWFNASFTDSFKWDADSLGLGWGNTPLPLGAGQLYTWKQPMVPVDPGAAGGANTVPISFDKEFFAGPATCVAGLGRQLAINTDRSFTVGNASTMAVAFYVDGAAALAQQGMPNTRYAFASGSLSYYLTVTDFAAGTALPLQTCAPNISMGRNRVSTPTLVEFDAGATSVGYTLNDRLQFNKNI